MGRCPMHSNIHTPASLVLAAALLLGGSRAGYSQDNPPKDHYAGALVEGAALMDSGRYDEALSAYGRRGGEMGEELLRRAETAEPRRASALRRVWLDFFPFGRLFWMLQAREWDETAYTWLVSIRAAPTENEAVRESLAALEDYRLLASARDVRNFERVLALADHIVREHPRSLFTAPAVLSLAVAKRGRPLSGADLGRWISKMERAGATARAILLVSMARVARDLKKMGPHRPRSAVDGYRRIRNTTSISYEKRWALLGEAEALGRVGADSARAQSRALFLEFLKNYPGVPERRTARMGIVRTYLSGGAPKAALEAVRRLEAARPERVFVGEELFAVARGFFRSGESKRSLELLREITARFSEGSVAPRAWLGMGEVLRRLGDETAMVEAYRQAAQLKPVDTHANPMDASNTANRAVEFLGLHYMKKGDHPEALRWWMDREPGSWCGNCSISLRTRRRQRIEACRAEIEKSEEALRRLGTKALDPNWILPGFSLYYADLMIARGRSADLRRQVEAALADPVRAPGARTLETYLKMIRAAELKDARAIWARLVEGLTAGSKETWKIEKSADPLLTIPDSTIPVARKWLESGTREEARLAASLLARLRDDGALSLFRSRIDATTSHRRQLATWFWRLASMKTEKALALLREYAEGEDPRRAEAARTALRSLAR